MPTSSFTTRILLPANVARLSAISAGGLADRAYNVDVPKRFRLIASAVVGVALIASALPIAWAQTSPPARTQTPGAEDPALAAIRADLDRVREELAAMRGELRALRDRLFQNQQALAAGQLPTYADRLGLDRAAFGTCLNSGKYAAAVQKNFGDGAAAGVRGTPSFVIGRTRPDDTVEGLLLTGARP